MKFDYYSSNLIVGGIGFCIGSFIDNIHLTIFSCALIISGAILLNSSKKN